MGETRGADAGKTGRCPCIGQRGVGQSTYSSRYPKQGSSRKSMQIWKKKNPIYGRELPLAVYDEDSDRKRVILIKSFRNKLREVVKGEKPYIRKKVCPEKMEKEMDWNKS